MPQFMLSKKINLEEAQICHLIYDGALNPLNGCWPNALTSTIRRSRVLEDVEWVHEQ